MWQNYFIVTTIDEAIKILGEYGERARIIAGGTDLILELERGVRMGIDTLVDVSCISELDQITQDEDGFIHLGPLVTHNQCVASKLIFERAFPLAQACSQVGAPPIRNRGTIAGNIITASPANDTISPLIALGASVVLSSKSGQRVIALEDFYTGVRKTVMNPDEVMIDIFFPGLKTNQPGSFVKLSLRQAQAISLVNVAICLTLEKATSDKILIGNIRGNGRESFGALGRKIIHADITLGAVAPKIVRAREAEAYLVGRMMGEETIETAARLAQESALPISDIRSSHDYRLEMVRVCVKRGLRLILHGEERNGFPTRPVLLWGKQHNNRRLIHNPMHFSNNDPIQTTINGKKYTFLSGQHKTLLRLLREEAGLTGTKEGCAEGECGACTVFLDGMAVMSCLIPAARAHGSEITTIEGLTYNNSTPSYSSYHQTSERNALANVGLHPVQQAFIEAGAVQCGYCTPGFIMSAVKLLEESSDPSRSEITQAITGNLCRCTGYYSIVTAIEKAAEKIQLTNKMHKQL